VSTQPPEIVWTPEMVRRFWIWQRMRPTEYFSFQVGRVIARRFRKYLRGRVVDHGAGPGFLVDELLSAGVQCGATEYGEDSTDALARQFAGRPNFLGARNNDRLADWQGTFDTAFLCEVVEHLYDRELYECLAVVRSLLKPSGLLIVTTPNQEDRRASFICSPESGLLFHRYQHVRTWDAASLSDALRKAGFAVQETGATDFGAHPAAHHRTRPLPVRLLRSGITSLMRRTPHLYCVAARAG
jgi:SAM-dependent methyltransferase